MAMDKDVLGLALAQVVMKASSIMPEGAQLANIKKMWTDIADEIITHIQDNAQVLPGIAVSTSGGPGSTTSPGTIE